METITLKDGREMKLGRRRPIARPQCLRFAVYYDPKKDQQPPPATVDWAAKAANALKRVYLNDRYGDCVIAGKYHQLGVWTGNETGTAVEASDGEVYSSYQQICGPGDNGCVITDVLDVMRDRGLMCNGVLRKIDGYVAVDWTNKQEVQVALEIFGSLTIGIDLPDAWTCTNCVWDVTNTRNVGGHDVCCVGYNAQGVQIATWGGLVTITWAAFTSRTWISECYAQLSPDWYSQANLAPNGINAQMLKDDLAKLGGGTIPPLPDPVPPPPPGPTPVPPPPPGPTPVPPPGPVPPPMPTVFTVNIPDQRVYGELGLPIGTVPAFTVQGTLGTQEAPHLPPWLLAIIRAICSSPNLPPALQAICALVPRTGKGPCGCSEAAALSAWLK